MTDGTRPRAEEFTTELPQFVADRLGERPAPAGDEQVEETVAALVELGLSEDAAREAVRADRVPLALASQVLGDDATLELETVCDQAGVDPLLVKRVIVAAGLTVPERLTEGDRDWVEGLAALLDHMPVEAMVRAARVRGSALGTVARADLALIREEIMLPMRRAGADDLTVSVALAETARAIGPLSRRMLVHEYHRQLLHQIDSELSVLLARSDGQEIDVAVGFVDLVGYTSLSAQVDPEGLENVLEAFEQIVIEVVAENDRVGIVKYLGDAAMLVASDPRTLAETMLGLVEPVSELEDAPLRGGLAAGPTLIREGDYFGQPVNMAARLTDLARPWSLLAAEELVDDLESDFDVRRIRPTRIRGIGLRRPLSVRRPVPG